MPSPYRCPRHNVALVARVLALVTRRNQVKRIRYFACPESGCSHMKPDKWANRKRYVTD